jgi:hypothetical protein
MKSLFTLFSILALSVLATLFTTPASSACIPCGKMMPICKCADQSDCSYIPQSCLECAHYKCGEKNTVGSGAVSNNDQGKGAAGQKKQDEGQFCIICPLVIPDCSACSRAGRRCQIVQQTCHRCAYAQCV